MDTEETILSGRPGPSHGFSHGFLGTAGVLEQMKREPLLGICLGSCFEGLPLGALYSSIIVYKYIVYSQHIKLSILYYSRFHCAGGRVSKE